MAGGVAALAVAQEAAEDDEVAGARDVEAANVQERDAVVLLSASGGTPYVVGAAQAARRTGALTVALVCAGDSELGRLAEHEVAVVVGPEVIAGSTRMKAGTAQKLLLNTISTVTMVRLGKTYGNLMVDVVASNAKLRNRARSAVVIATGAPEAEVDAALESSAGDVKVAIVSLLTGVDAADARSRLDAAGGVVRRALVQDAAHEAGRRGRDRRRRAAARRHRGRGRTDRRGRPRTGAGRGYRRTRIRRPAGERLRAASTSRPPTRPVTPPPARRCSKAASRRTSRP